MKKIVVFLTIVGLFLSGCSTNKERSEKNTVPKETISSSVKISGKEIPKRVESFDTENGNYQVTLTEEWQPAEWDGIADFSDINIQNIEKDEYFVVISENKVDFETFESYKELMDFSDFGEIVDKTTETITYNGFNGERHRFSTSIDGINLYYIYDILEGKNYYLQSFSYTLKSNQEKAEKELLDVMNSLVEVE